MIRALGVTQGVEKIRWELEQHPGFAVKEMVS
jgi:hypothetical protein